MNRTVGIVRPSSFCESDIDLAVTKPVEERLIATLRRWAALRSVWASIVWSSPRFFTHFSRTFTRLRICCPRLIVRVYFRIENKSLEFNFIYGARVRREIPKKAC